MNLDNLTLGDLRQLKSVLNGTENLPEFPLVVGKNYFIRTVTYFHTGKLKALYKDALVLSEAAWIADTGRFYDFLKTGKVNEVEPFVDDVVIPLGSCVDFTEWRHELFKSQK